jgi:hypothetical protein
MHLPRHDRTFQRRVCGMSGFSGVLSVGAFWSLCSPGLAAQVVQDARERPEVLGTFR